MSCHGLPLTFHGLPLTFHGLPSAKVLSEWHNSVNPLWVPELDGGVYLGIAHRHYLSRPTDPEIVAASKQEPWAGTKGGAAGRLGSASHGVRADTIKWQKARLWATKPMYGANGTVHDPQRRPPFPFGSGYRRVLYTLTRDMRIRRHSKEFCMPALGGDVAAAGQPSACEAVQYVHSVVRAHDDAVSMLYGINDCTSGRATLSLKRLDELLEYTYEPPPEGAPVPDEMAPARKKTKGPGKEEKGQMAARGGYPHAMSKDGKASQGGRLPKPPPGARFEKPLGMSQKTFAKREAAGYVMNEGGHVKSDAASRPPPGYLKPGHAKAKPPPGSHLPQQPSVGKSAQSSPFYGRAASAYASGYARPSDEAKKPKPPPGDVDAKRMAKQAAHQAHQASQLQRKMARHKSGQGGEA